MASKNFADDYETVITTDEKGKEVKTAVYRGRYFETENSEDHLKNFKRICILIIIAMVTMHVVGGMIANRGMYQFYIGLPYVLAFFPMLYLAEGVLRLPKTKKKYRRDEIGHSFEQMKTAGYALLAILGVGILGEAAYLIFYPAHEKIDVEILYLLIEIVVFAEMFFITRMQKKIKIVESPGS